MKTFTELGKLYKINSQNHGPHVLISAGVHGDEFEPILAAHALVSVLKNLVVAGKVSIVPAVNSTAVKAGTRMGDDGLDLARICPGNLKGSRTEKDAAYISHLITTADYYIDMHTGGNHFNMFPLAGYMIHPSAEILEKQRWMAAAFNLPLVWGTESSPMGRTISIAKEHSIPAIYVEYGGGATFTKEIEASYVLGCMSVLERLNMMDLKSGRRHAVPTYWVEDDTPGAGYLQGKLPAPIDGIFVPEMSAGEMVTQYDLLGSIINPVTGFHTEVRAGMSGLLFFTRTASRVYKGDALGGVLPISKPGKVVINAK